MEIERERTQPLRPTMRRLIFLRWGVAPPPSDLARFFRPEFSVYLLDPQRGRLRRPHVTSFGEAKGRPKGAKALLAVDLKSRGVPQEKRWKNPSRI